MIIISLWLHGKPNWALPIEGKNEIDPYVIREYADILSGHLYKIAVITAKLQNSGWRLIESYGQLYGLEYCKEGITRENLYKELEKMQISIEDVSIEELSDNAINCKTNQL